MPEPGRRSANRRAGPGGGAGPFRRAPRSRPSLHTPGTAAAGRRPAPPAHSRVPRRRMRRLRGRTRARAQRSSLRAVPMPRSAPPPPARSSPAAGGSAPARPRLTFPGAPPPAPPHRWPRIYFRRRAGRAFPTPPEPAIWAELEPD